jgi:branched-chain amino acid transport system substrate-binding protein
MFSSFGTANIGAVQKYLADRKVPQIFFVSGARKWEDRRRYSSMVGWQPTYHREGMIFAHYLLRARPQAKIGVLYQNDDYGRDYLQGLKDGLGAKADASIVSELTYQASDPTIESQIVTLKASGADVFIDIAAAKFAAQAIRKTHEIGWKPLHLLNSVSSSISAVLDPAGLESSVGIVSTAYVKDPTDPQFEGDAGIREYLDFVRREFPEGGAANMQNANAYARSMAFAEVLRRCGDDLSPDNIVRKAQALDFENPMLLPGIRLRSADNDTDIGDLQLQRFNGHGWEGLADQPDLSSDGRR